MIQEDGNFLIFPCPHCEQYITVAKNEINCKIFRHGVFKNDFNQMNPHEKKEKCDQFSQNDTIYGCGKPFRIENNKVEICDYI